MIGIKKVIAVIPARAGSKRLPGKNIKILAGQPLICHTIREARKSRYIDGIVVTTDSFAIAKIAEKHGVPCPFIRPSSLSGDNIPLIKVVKHALLLSIKNGFKADYVITLQPTSPLRECRHIDRALEAFHRNARLPVIGVTETAETPYWTVRINNGRAYPVVDDKNNYWLKRKQDLPKTYRINGALYISKVAFAMKGDTLIPENGFRAFIMKDEESVDIDTLEDFVKADRALSLRGNRLKKRVNSGKKV